MTTPLKHLSELLERLEHAEFTYKTSQSSLDGSLALILAKEDLRNARFDFAQACMTYVVENVLNKEEVET